MNINNKCYYCNGNGSLNVCINCDLTVCENCSSQCDYRICPFIVCDSCRNYENKECKSCGHFMCSRYCKEIYNHCSECGENRCTTCSKKCYNCEEMMCTQCESYCNSCNTSNCNKCSSLCVYCNASLCDECSFRCESKWKKTEQCHERMHPECRKTCGICHKFLCKNHYNTVFNSICVCPDHPIISKK